MSEGSKKNEYRKSNFVVCIFRVAKNPQLLKGGINLGILGNEPGIVRNFGKF